MNDIENILELSRVIPSVSAAIPSAVAQLLMVLMQRASCIEKMLEWRGQYIDAGGAIAPEIPHH
ncbi:MAG: hypothetical protein VKL39_10560 [Leptolyngbyaceae bacterium]|nr:hypothetical protein [Leptolyngbyaceae bacterium]